MVSLPWFSRQSLNLSKLALNTLLTLGGSKTHLPKCWEYRCVGLNIKNSDLFCVCFMLHMCMYMYIFTVKEVECKSLITGIIYVIIDESNDNRLLVVFGGMLVNLEIPYL